MRRLRSKGWLLLITVALAGCGSSRKAASVAEMKRVQAAFGDLQIALDAGVTKQEFGQRVNDTLVKIGNLQNSAKLAENGLPKDKVAQVYIHFYRAAEAYKLSKDFFGERWDYLLESTTDSTSEAEQNMVKALFPELAERTESYRLYSRGSTLQDLWKLAGEETQAASRLIDQLDQK